MKLRRLFAKWVLLPAMCLALFSGLFSVGVYLLGQTNQGRFSQAMADGLPITRNEVLRVYSQVVGATSRNGHYLNGAAADTFGAGATASSQIETTYAIPIWGMRKGVLIVRDSSIVGAPYVDSMQVTYSLSWDGVNSGSNWTQPRTVNSASYAQNKPGLPDTFMIAFRARIDSTIGISAQALTDGGFIPIYFWQHTDSTTVQSHETVLYPYIRFMFTPKTRFRGVGTTQAAQMIGLRAEFHGVYEIQNPYKTGGP